MPRPIPHWLAGARGGDGAAWRRIAEARAETVAALSAELDTRRTAPSPRPLLALDGQRPARSRAGRCARTARRRRRRRARSIGPHRADLAVTHAAKGEPAARGSTGEQKALLIAIILAHAALVAARTGRPPLLLLDEIAAHLDAVAAPRCSSGWRHRGAGVDDRHRCGAVRWRRQRQPAAHRCRPGHPGLTLRSSHFAAGRGTVALSIGQDRPKISCKTRLGGIMEIDAPQAWPTSRAKTWYDRQPWRFGCNFVPSRRSTRSRCGRPKPSIRR